MEYEMYRNLFLDIKYGETIHKYTVSQNFIILHNVMVSKIHSEKQFILKANIVAERKDQLLLNLQYNKLLNGLYRYSYEDYKRNMEEFFTYFLNYELITGYWCPEFPNMVQKIFDIFNKYV